jgi:hypothetical protein
VGSRIRRAPSSAGPAAGADSERGRPLEAGPLFRSVFALIARYPFAALLPAVVLGAAADTLQLVEDDLLASVALGLALALGFELYVGYAELIVVEAERGAPRIRAGRLLRRALPLLPALVAASVIGVTLPLAASGALVIPGLWLATRWSLFAPAISREDLGPIAALRRSSVLVRGSSWAVFLTVTLSLLIEHAVVHAMAHTAEPLLGSQLAAMLAAGLVVAAVSAPAAFTISLAYDRLALAEAGPA